MCKVCGRWARDKRHRCSPGTFEARHVSWMLDETREADGSKQGRFFSAARQCSTACFRLCLAAFVDALLCDKIKITQNKYRPSTGGRHGAQQMPAGSTMSRACRAATASACEPQQVSCGICHGGLVSNQSCGAVDGVSIHGEATHSVCTSNGTVARHTGKPYVRLAGNHAAIRHTI